MAEPARPLADLRILAAEAAPVAARPPEPAEAQKRAFLRLISHELRTPLNSILGFSEILAGELYGPLGAPQYREYAEIVRQSGQKMLELVNQLLELARLQSGVSDLAAQSEPLGAAFDDVLDGFGERAVRVDVAEGVAGLTALADPRGLRTVIANLLGGALAQSPGDSVVKLSARRCGGEIEIEVVDAGEEVAAQDLPRLLRPFDAAEAGDGAPGRAGSGLGLPTAALLCAAMGGRLELSSGPGQGLTATARLPAA